MSNTCYMHIDEAKWYWVDENKKGAYTFFYEKISTEAATKSFL